MGSCGPQSVTLNMTKRLSAQAGDESADVGEVFRVSYISLFVLLLAFFVFLVSLTTADALKTSEVRESLDQQFAHEEAAREAEDARRIAELAREYGFGLTRARDHMLVTLPGSSVFESGSDIVRAEMAPALSGIADIVHKLNLWVVIEGHTDNIPIQNERFPSNWELSAARATSVLRLFLDHGIPTDHLAAAGRAEYLPAASNETEQGRAQNRRVTLRISSKGS